MWITLSMEIIARSIRKACNFPAIVNITRSSEVAPLHWRCSIKSFFLLINHTDICMYSDGVDGALDFHSVHYFHSSFWCVREFRNDKILLTVSTTWRFVTWINTRMISGERFWMGRMLQCFSQLVSPADNMYRYLAYFDLGIL